MVPRHFRLIFAIVGGAVLVPAMGYVADHLGSIALAYTIPLVVYALVAFYSVADLRLMRSSSGAAGE